MDVIGIFLHGAQRRSHWPLTSGFDDTVSSDVPIGWPLTRFGVTLIFPHEKSTPCGMWTFVKILLSLSQYASDLNEVWCDPCELATVYCVSDPVSQ